MKAEQALVKASTELVNGFIQITLEVPEAEFAKPGQYVVVEEKPCYLMSADANTVTLIVNKAIMPNVNVGSSVWVSPFHGEELPPPDNTFCLIEANEEGLNAVIFYLKKYRRAFQGLILVGAKQFPFKPCPSRLLIPGIPNDVIAAIPLLEDWQIPHRLASSNEQPGCFHGTTEELASLWLNQTKIVKPSKKLYITPLRNN